jgi:Rps23 Pro-64 3,4-dihydroxylase Tpa1-like proline 4-hydroxylase
MDRKELGSAIAERLEVARADLAAQFRAPGRIQTFVLDEVLDPARAREIYEAFPPSSDMVLHDTLRERKYVAVQMDRYRRLCEEILYGFQEPGVLALVGEITGIARLFPDPELYAGGLSQMERGHFLNPHIDNSHDRDRQRYRVLNLLYYVTPEWREEYGGNLELWDSGLKGEPRVIHSRFNRLVCMVTHRRSWHSVQPVRNDGRRCCVSNYYFSPDPLEPAPYFHPTSFRGRPEEPLRDLVLRGDGWLRRGIRLVLPHGLRENPHVYKKPGD